MLIQRLARKPSLILLCPKDTGRLLQPGALGVWNNNQVGQFKFYSFAVAMFRLSNPEYARSDRQLFLILFFRR
jgi:hypothetical protein